MKRPVAVRRFFRRWMLVSGALVLAGHCPCFGRAGCATGLGTATAMGGLLAGAVTSVKPASSWPQPWRRPCPWSPIN